MLPSWDTPFSSAAILSEYATDSGLFLAILWFFVVDYYYGYIHNNNGLYNMDYCHRRTDI